MRKIVVLGCFLGALAPAAMAQQADPVRERQALMKNNQEQLRPLAAMARGQAPFDAAVVQASMRAIERNATRIPALFPPNSMQGETAALPVIWERKADFDARAAKLAQDAAAAVTRVTDQASLQAAVQTIGQSCGGCHEAYRKKPAQ